MTAYRTPNAPRWRRRALVGLGVIALAAVSLLVVVHRVADPERLAEWLQPRISRVLKRDVTIGAASVGVFPPRFELHDLSLADSTGLAPVLARADAVRLRFRLLPLLRGEVVVGRIEFMRPSVDLRVAVDGLSNLPGSPDSIADERGRLPMSLDVRRIETIGGRITYRSDLDSVSVVVDSLDVVSAVQRSASGGWRFDGTAESLIGRSGPLGPDLVGVTVTAGFALDATPGIDTVTIREGSLGLEGIELTLTGTVSEVKRPIRALDLAATVTGLPLARVVEALPDSVRVRFGSATGTVSAGISVRGSFGREVRPTASGLISLDGARLEASSGALLAENVEGHVELLEDGSVIPSLLGDVFGGPTTLDGSMWLGDVRHASLSLRAKPDLGLLASFVDLPEGMLITGQLGIDVDLDVPLDVPTDAIGHGTVTLSAARVRAPQLGGALSIADGVARLDGRRLLFTDLPVDLGRERFLVTAELLDLVAFGAADGTPYLGASVRGPRLTLHTLSARVPADTAYTYGRVAFAHLGGRSVGGVGSVQAARELHLTRPGPLPISGQVSIAIDTVLDRRGRSEDLRAEVEFGPDFVHVSEASLRRYGGEIVAGATLSLGSEADQPFTMSMRAEAVEATAFLGSTTSLGRAVRGTLSADLDVAGALDELMLPLAGTLVGGGRFTLAQGALNASPLTEHLAAYLGVAELSEPTVRDWSASFTVEAGAVRVAESALEGAPAAPRVGGAIGFDGSLDVAATFDLPRVRLDSATVDRLGGAGLVAQRALESGSLTRAVLRVTGTVDAPRLSTVLGDDAPMETLGEAATDAAAQEIREQIRSRREDIERRAGGAIRDLLLRRAPGAVVPVRPDTIRFGTDRPDTLRPDTIRSGPR
jgi:hypothetical protein